MEIYQNTATTISATAKKKSSLTPRELIKYHIANPEEPITDEDIQNLNLDYQTGSGFYLRDFYLTEEE